MNAQMFDRSEVAGTLKPLDEATWLTQRAYTDPAIYDVENERIFLKEWMAVFHHTTLPNIGDYRTMDIAGKPLLFVRDQERRIRCYINVCRHRGMAIAKGNGNCYGFVCPYHTWSYDLDGKVIATPQIKGNWAKGGVRLTEVRTEIYVGYLFISFDTSATSVAERLGGVATDLKAWNDADLEVLFEKTYVCRWNWKLMWENGIEAYHVLGIHRESVHTHIPSEKAYVTAPDSEANYVILHTPYQDTGSNAFGAQAEAIPTIPNLPAWTAKESRFYTFWPISQFSTGTESLNGFFVLPGPSIDEHLVVWTMAVSRKAKQHPKYEAYKAEQIAYGDRIMDEDLPPCERIERTYKTCTDWIPGPYSYTEKPCWNFHHWYLKRLGIR
jgi:phenylpropionate dioxygenase-like ring-hydroxylating dioxygenase large terminal subunit